MIVLRYSEYMRPDIACGSMMPSVQNQYFIINTAESNLMQILCGSDGVFLWRMDSSLQVRTADTPVPFSRQKLKIRGYNQAGILAEKSGISCRFQGEQQRIVQNHSTATAERTGESGA